MESNELINGYKCELTVNDESKGFFGVIGFKHSMEIAAGINKHYDDSEKKSQKIESLAENELIREPIQDIFL